MIDFKQQLNSSDKTLDELVKEAFRENKPVVDVSFFYDEKNEINKVGIPNTDIKPPNSIG